MMQHTFWKLETEILENDMKSLFNDLTYNFHMDILLLYTWPCIFLAPLGLTKDKYNA